MGSIKNHCLVNLTRNGTLQVPPSSHCKDRRWKISNMVKFSLKCLNYLQSQLLAHPYTWWKISSEPSDNHKISIFEKNWGQKIICLSQMCKKSKIEAHRNSVGAQANRYKNHSECHNKTEGVKRGKIVPPPPIPHNKCNGGSQQRLYIKKNS